MLAKVGLSKTDVDIQAPGPAGVWKLFLARQADAMAGVPDFLAEAERNGMKVRVYPSQDYFRSMAQAILASDTTIAKRPELIRKLVRATLRGMKDIMDDPRAAAADHVKAVPQLSDQQSYVLRVFELYKQYVYGGAVKLGIMGRGVADPGSGLSTRRRYRRAEVAGARALYQPVHRLIEPLPEPRSPIWEYDPAGQRSRCAPLPVGRGLG
jgi:hypothetical protein